MLLKVIYTFSIYINLDKLARTEYEPWMLTSGRGPYTEDIVKVMQQEALLYFFKNNI